MKSKVEILPSSRAKVHVALNQSDLDDIEPISISKLSFDITVPGFRKGKAPIGILKKHIDANTLNNQIIEDAVTSHMIEAFQKHDLKALEQPKIEITKFVPSKNLEFHAEADIMPKVTLGEYKGLKIVKEKITVSKKEIDDVVENIRSNYAVKKPADRSVKNGDEVIIDFEGFKDDKPFPGGKATDYSLIIGSNSFIEGFEKGIIGKNRNDQFSLNLKFPDNYSEKTLANKDVVFKVTLKEVFTRELPKVDEEFIKQLGSKTISSLDDLKKEIKKDLSMQKQKLADNQYIEKLVKKITEDSAVEIPKILIADRLNFIEDDLKRNLEYRKKSFEEYLNELGLKNRDEWVEKVANNQAENFVKESLVLNELSKNFKIEITKKELDSRINQMKEQYKNSPEVIKQLDSTETINNLKNQMVIEQTIQKLKELN